MSEILRSQNTFSLWDSEHRQFSPLMLRAQEKLATLPLDRVRQAGIWRDRSTYFLNISYPSMQAMAEIDSLAIQPEISQTGEGKTVALYIHIPFCTAECYYCHYYKQFAKPSSQVDIYLDSLERELVLHRERFGGLRARSIYVGGGTPSYLTPEQIDRLFTMVKQYVEVPEGIEVSFEVHPESGTQDRLDTLKAHGVNRINIGIESFDNQLLQSENRRHTVAQAEETYYRIHQTGFENINLDLIYGLKGQTVESWEKSLERVKALQPASATMYFLRLKKGTPEYNLWKRYPEQFASDADLLLMHAMNFEQMEGELGYLQNPVDWYIKDPSYFHTYQDHNWRRSDETELLGIGASAYSYVNGWQYYNVNDTNRYQAAVNSGNLAVWKGEKLEGDERMRRTVMLGIKMGMNRKSFAQTYGLDVVEAFAETWQVLQQLGLVEITPESVSLTYMGKLLADEVGQQFYSNDMKRRMMAIDPALVSTTWPQFNP